MMEQQTKEELYSHLADRLHGCFELVSGPNLVRTKERRQYSTEVLPIDLPGLRIGSLAVPHYLQPSAIGYPLLSEIVLLFERMSDTGDVLSPLPSRKVRIPVTGLTIRGSIARAVKFLGQGGRMGTLLELFRLHGRERHYIVAMTGPISQNPYVSHLLRLFEDGVPTPAQWFEFHAIWGRPLAIVLRDVLYLHRGERRAFAVDKDELRSLLGAIIHSLLTPPKNVRDRYQPYKSCYPTKGKNVLFEEHTILLSEELVIIFGDISSFTASLKNIWTVLIGVIHMLEQRESSSEPLIVQIRGQYLETTLLEVLKCYLFLGSAAQTMDGDDSFTSLGAMLGMQGVDTLAKVVFSLFTRVLCSRTSGSKYIIPKLGGDDFVLQMVIKRNKPYERDNIIAGIKEELEKYIGHVKDMNMILVPAGICDFITPTTYCKKPVRVRTTTNNTHQVIQLASQYPIPLFKSLLDEVHSETTGNSLWEATKSCPWVPEHREIREEIMALHSRIHPRVFSRTGPHHLRQDPPKYYDGYSELAANYLSKIPDVRGPNGRMYRTTFHEKKQACSPKIFSSRNYFSGDSSVSVVTLSSERDGVTYGEPRDVPNQSTRAPEDLLAVVQEVRQQLRQIPFK